MHPWYLLYCKRSEQERAMVNLNRQGVDCYYPTVSVSKLRRGKRVELQEPLFPCYMFVSFDIEKVSFTTVRSTRGVADFVRTGEMPTLVSKELIFNLMTHEDSDEQREALSELPESGDKYVIDDEQYNQLDAIYKEPDGEKRSWMLVTMMGKQVAVSVPNTSLKK